MDRIGGTATDGWRYRDGPVDGTGLDFEAVPAWPDGR